MKWLMMLNVWFLLVGCANRSFSEMLGGAPYIHEKEIIKTLETIKIVPSSIVLDCEIYSQNDVFSIENKFEGYWKLYLANKVYNLDNGNVVKIKSLNNKKAVYDTYKCRQKEFDRIKIITGKKLNITSCQKVGSLNKKYKYMKRVASFKSAAKLIVDSELMYEVFQENGNTFIEKARSMGILSNEVELIGDIYRCI